MAKITQILITFALIGASLSALIKNKDAEIKQSSGKVFLIGGATDDNTASIYNAIREATGKDTPKIAVAISAAGSLEVGHDAYYTDYPDSLSYRQLFINYGFEPSVIELAMDNYQEGNSNGTTIGAANIEIVRNADVVFFNGGDQSRHSRCWFNDDGSDSDIMQVLRQRFAQDLVVAGTSAGAAFQSDPTYGEGYSYGYYFFNADLKPCAVGESMVDDREGSNGFRADENGGYLKGLGFVQDAVVDSHFDARGRIGRLPTAMKSTGKSMGFGVGEDTALYINGNVATAYGTEGVWIVDSSAAVFNESEPHFTATGLRFSYLTQGDVYIFNSKQVFSTKELISTNTGTNYQSKDVFSSNEGIKSIKALVLSSATQSVTHSHKKNPTAEVIFYKNQGENSYFTDGMFTIDKMRMDFKTEN